MKVNMYYKVRKQDEEQIKNILTQYKRKYKIKGSYNLIDLCVDLISEIELKQKQVASADKDLKKLNDSNKELLFLEAIVLNKIAQRELKKDKAKTYGGYND